MLNKLLKRCMPWMDKGRWYKLVLQGTGNTFIVDKELSDPIFYKAHASFNADDATITIENPGAVFLENKCTIEYIHTLIGITLDLYSVINMLTIASPINSVTVIPAAGVKMTLYMFGR